MLDRPVRLAIVGLEFGAEFIPIYQRHPDAELVAICQRTRSRLDEIGDRFEVAERYTSFEEVLANPSIDAVHINTPLLNHAEHVLASLRAGKHVGCTIPMAASVEDCRQIVAAVEETGLVYMMMETVLYSREFLFVRDLYTSGQFGTLQFLRSSHQQDMTGWPSYWDGMPPMHNATHAISPVIALGEDQAESVRGLGSGRVFPSMRDRYGSPFSVETAHVRFVGGRRGAEVTRSLWGLAREYRESFDVYGSVRSFEWSQLAGECPVVYTGEDAQRLDVPDFADRLPVEIRGFTRSGVYGDEETHRSFAQGGGHGGSHPHLADRLVRAVRGEVEPFPDAVTAANITCTGILAHESALRGGESLALPEWTIRQDRYPFEVELAEEPQPAWKGAGPLGSAQLA